MAPEDVNPLNAKKLYEDVYAVHVQGKNRKKLKLKFKIGDYVRMSKVKQLFEKGYLTNFTTEIFEVYRVISSVPPMYLLKDLKGEEIKGGFYEHELQKTTRSDIYLVEKVLQKKNGKLKVRWLGFPTSEDSWINEKDYVD